MNRAALIVGVSIPLIISNHATAAENHAFHKRFSGVSDIAVGFDRSYAITEDGSLWAWGQNFQGELGNGTFRLNAHSPEKVNIENVKDISSGDYHAVAVTQDGTVWGWGRNAEGQLGIGGDSQKPMSQPQRLDIDNVVSVSASEDRSFAVKKDGSVWAWGKNRYGELGIPRSERQSTPIQIPDLSNIIKVSSGSGSTLALSEDGNVWEWGINYKNEIDIKPTKIEALSDIIDVSTSNGGHLALKTDGTVWQWPSYTSLYLGTTPQKVEGLPPIKSIASGYGFAASIDKDGNVWTWQQESLPQKFEGINNATKVAVGVRHNIVLTEDKQLFAWGDNRYGQLGINQTINRTDKPMPVAKPIAVFLNGKQLDIALSPLLETDTTLVPLRGIFEEMGANVLWDMDTKTVTASNGNTKIVLKPGEDKATINGEQVQLNKSAKIVSESVFVPLRFVSEALGARVEWDENEYAVKLFTN